MRIAIVSQLMFPIPPAKYGGIELIVDELVHGLAERGHDVTIFCCGGSTIEGKGITRIETCPFPTEGKVSENRRRELEQFSEVVARQHDFDLIHFNYEPVILKRDSKEGGGNFLDDLERPAALTFHNVTDLPERIGYYRSAVSLHRHEMIFVSENQRRPLPFFPNSRVIYNAIRMEDYRIGSDKDGYMFFLGRITRSKGILEAIEAAEKIGIPLLIAAKIDDSDKDFYEREVKSRIDGKLVRYVGEVGLAEKVGYLKKARCLLFPISWEEPFGLVMVEALACGTPVIAFRCGSVPEIIENGKNGFVVDDVDGMADAVTKAGSISPEACRKSVEEKFSVDRMVSEYEKLFQDMLEKNGSEG